MLERKARRLHEGNLDIDQKFMEAYSGAGFIQKPVVEKLNDILYADTCTGGLETLLRYADRNAMAHGLELRLPFLQHDLVSFVFSLPASFRIRKGVTKWILRESYRTSIPENILRRKGKIGFEAPQFNWMQDERVKGEIRKGQQKLVDAGMLNPAVLSRDIKSSSAYAPDNRDWRYWVVSQFL
jgi:asparagine synthase (glutamine-hydrolysing)